MDRLVADLVEEEQVVEAPPAHFRRRYSRIGLDLGSSQVKLVQLKHRRSSICLHQFAIYDLPPGAITSGRITDRELLAERLSWVMKRRRFYKNRVNLCIGSQAVILRHLQLPRLAPRELSAAVRFEAEKRIMIPLEEAVIDYAVLGERVVEGNELYDLALVAAPKDAINDYLSVILQAGLYPDVIETESFALQRVLPLICADFSKPGQEALMLLDLGFEGSNLVVFDEGSFSFARTLNVGMQQFCKHISERRGIDSEAARRLLFSSDPFDVEGFQEIADELVTQIRRSLQFYLYNVGHDHKEIRTLFLCGGGAVINRLPSFLGFELKVEPKVLNPFRFINSDSRYSSGDREREGHMLNVAAGLALRGWLR